MDAKNWLHCSSPWKTVLVALGMAVIAGGCGGGGGGGQGGGETVLMPLITDPYDLYVVEGSTARFEIGWVGNCTQIGWQWQRNQANLTGHSGTGCPATPYEVQSVSMTDNGAKFRFVLTNGQQTVASADALLTVIPRSRRTQVADTGTRSHQCYRAGSNDLVSCLSAEAFSLSDTQDGMMIEGFGFSRSNSHETLVGTPTCVSDNVTGLMWQGSTRQHITGTVGQLLLNYLEAREYRDSANGLSLCGFSDWRIPTLTEAVSIRNFGRSPELQPWFRGEDDATWTDTYPASEGPSSNHRWVVSGGTSMVDASRTDTNIPVRLVRGVIANAVNPDQRFEPIAGGLEVRDHKTGLIWKRCSEGRSWSGSQCTGVPLIANHEGAMSYTGSTGGWRLPNIIELASIIPSSETPGGGVLTDAAPEFNNNCFWSSTPGDGRFALYVETLSDGTMRHVKSGSMTRDMRLCRFRLVRPN